MEIVKVNVKYEAIPRKFFNFKLVGVLIAFLLFIGCAVKTWLPETTITQQTQLVVTPLDDDYNREFEDSVDIKEIPVGTVEKNITKIQKKIEQAHQQLQNETSTFAYWMHYLKYREGYMSQVYKCAAGKNTVGYGYNLDAHGRKGIEKELEDGVIEYQEASGMLYKQAEEQYKQICVLLPNLNKSQKLAVTSLALNCGIGKIMYPGGKKAKGYSTFWNKLKNGQVPNFETYCRYKTPGGVVVTSKWLQDARKFEKALFTGNLTYVKAKAEKFKEVVINRDIHKSK